MHGSAKTPILGVLLAALLLGLPALAGPPFLTDDPETVPYRHGEFYLFGTMDHAPDGTTGLGPAAEFNWGLAKNLQFHLICPTAYSSPTRGSSAAGLGDVQLGLKIRFVEESPSTPQVGLFPAVVFSTGEARRGLGSGGTVFQIPLWIQKSWGEWTTYGGGGYAVNRAPGGTNSFYGGWLIQRQVTEGLTLGGEVFSSGRSGESSPATTVLNLGGQMGLSEGFSLLFSLGRSMAGARHTLAYVGLYFTWGAPAGKG